MSAPHSDNLPDRILQMHEQAVREMVEPRDGISPTPVTFLLLCFFFTACAVMRLARFNVEQAGRKVSHFTGLPSPAAGMTLATYYWFSQTPLYTETIIGALPWHQMLRWVIMGLGMLMISNVQYAKVPTVDFRSFKGILGFLLVIGTFVGVIFLPKKFFFPALMAYVLYGILRTVFLGLLDRLPGRDDEDDDDEHYDEPVAPRRRNRRRRPSRPPSGPDTGREESPA
jgi:CDP-diacylglycerol--serine O-phosphatidyltransferase